MTTQTQRDIRALVYGVGAALVGRAEAEPDFVGMTSDMKNGA